MSDASEVVRKAKKMPWWIWLVALGALVVGYLVYEHYQNNSSSVDNNGSGLEDIGGVTSGDTGTDTSSDTSTDTGTGEAVSPYPSFENEAAYDDAAINEFGGQPGMSPLQVQSALDAYNAGSPLTDAQDAIIDAVTKALGQSPDFPGTLSFAAKPKTDTPKPSTTVAPKTTTAAKKTSTTTAKKATSSAKKKTTATKKAPAKTVTVTVKSGDTLTAIARKEGVSVRSLYDENKKVIGSNPNLIHPGQKLTVKK